MQSSDRRGVNTFYKSKDILSFQENITIWNFGAPYLKSANWSYIISIICFSAIEEIRKKLKTN